MKRTEIIKHKREEKAVSDEIRGRITEYFDGAKDVKKDIAVKVVKGKLINDSIKRISEDLQLLLFDLFVRNTLAKKRFWDARHPNKKNDT